MLNMLNVHCPSDNLKTGCLLLYMEAASIVICNKKSAALNMETLNIRKML